MNRFLCALLGLLLTALPALAQPPDPHQFVPGGALVGEFSLNVHCYGMAAASAGPFIYLLGGNTPPGTSDFIQRVDTRTNTVETLKERVFARYFACAVTVDEAIYIFGGTTSKDAFSGTCSVVERFDTRTEKVIRLSPSPQTLAPASGVQVGGKIYIASYGNPNLLIYDPAKAQWSQGAKFRARGHVKLAANGQFIYALGNFGGEQGKICQQYNVASDTWSDLPDMPFATDAYDLALANDSLFLFGETSDLSRVQRFDLTTRTWNRLFFTGFLGRRLPTALAVGDKIYVFGGKLQRIGTYQDGAQVFDATKLR